MGEIRLLMVGWDGRTGCGGGVIEGPTVADSGLRVLPLALEVQRTVGSGGCHNFHWCCRGRRVFVSVQKKYHNTLHTNPNCIIVQHSTMSKYDKIYYELLQNLQKTKIYQ